MTDTSTRIASPIRVSDPDLATAVHEPGGIAGLADRIRRTDADTVVLGADRFVQEQAHGPRVDPTSAALALGRALPAHRFLIAVAPTRDHPYNVARRVLSLDHVLAGRVGLLVGAHDHGAHDPAADDERSHDPAEFARVVRGLWATWPFDSIVGDRSTGVFADTDRIRPLDHDGGPGGYRVRGPLTTPSRPGGSPVLAVWDDVDLPDADLRLSAATPVLPADAAQRGPATAA
ncbi:LLM class flavin-dependent oxidoreductase [Curtobacterium sp. Curtsp57]|jgi:alkanesulfonate monooxygenase SsuD/methylene tetrahydromethanopterin reductase-like flavin-dependent oxidoreductase (luciferase family)|uniref:LLM class flavin-dependent oxidoreductase n=1 Tax=Curtobacterium sp. Curtsp57 TaxID=3243047 RepID=UPI0039B507C0